MPNNHLRFQAENHDSTPRVHLNSNAFKLSRFMVATRKYGGKYDMEARPWIDSHKPRPWFDSQIAVECLGWFDSQKAVVNK
jgi:hypothetical protein